VEVVNPLTKEQASPELQSTFENLVELTLPICMANFTDHFNDALELIPDLGV
jgi:hypothetical protein